MTTLRLSDGKRARLVQDLTSAPFMFHDKKKGTINMQNWIITAMVNHDEGHTVTLIKQLDTDPGTLPCGARMRRPFRAGAPEPQGIDGHSHPRRAHHAGACRPLPPSGRSAARPVPALQISRLGGLMRNAHERRSKGAAPRIPARIQAHTPGTAQKATGMHQTMAAPTPGEMPRIPAALLGKESGAGEQIAPAHISARKRGSP